MATADPPEPVSVRYPLHVDYCGVCTMPPEVRICGHHSVMSAIVVWYEIIISFAYSTVNTVQPLPSVMNG